MHKRVLLCGFLFLFTGAYFDSVRGPLLPILKNTFDVSYGQISLFLVMGQLAAIFCTLLLNPLLNRYSEKKVSIGACLLALITCLFAHAATSFPLLLVLAFFVGASYSVLVTLANILTIRGTTPENRTRILCGLHVMYSIGAFLAPLATDVFLAREVPWQCIMISVPFLLAILLIPLLIGIKGGEGSATVMKQSVRFTKVHWVILLAFCTYVAGEILTSMWMVTYLVEQEGFSVGHAANYLMGFFLVLALSRFLCFLSLKPAHEKGVLLGCLILSIIFIVLGHCGLLWAFCLAGIMGPYFPCLIARMSHSFPEQWRSLTIWVLFAIQIALVSLHLGVGSLTDWVGIKIAYTLPVILFLIAMTLLIIFFEWEKQLKPPQAAQI